MEREIKFRAWDKSDGQMYFAVEDGIQFDDGSSYEFRHFLTPREDDYHKWEVMQYTGLKDKNGKEIYEGDIIDNEGARQKYEVIFHKSCFCINRGGLGYHIFNEKKVKIIGNIYENKELIK